MALAPLDLPVPPGAAGAAQGICDFLHEAEGQMEHGKGS